MYPFIRRQDISEIGYYKNDQPGFPSENSKFHWVSQCNFTFRIIGKVKTLQKQEFGSQDEYSGWMLATTMLDQATKVEKYMYVSNETASSNPKLRKMFLKSLFGSVCRIRSEDFWRFVEQDMSDNRLKTCYVSTKCGKICMGEHEHFWIFPDISLSSTGRKINQEHVFISYGILMNGFKRNKVSMPNSFPIPASREQTNTQTLHKLGKLLKKYYGPRIPIALLILSSAIKALHRDTLLKYENQVSIMNVSGNPNIGKSFACAIALQLLGASKLMLSKCTSSAILDHADTFKNMLIVWDDPRDCPQTQMSSIIHEAFHGHSVSTISKGNRSYNSNLIIGTQQRLLGLPETTSHAPTFSRLTHGDFNFLPTDFQAAAEDEQNLKKLIQKHDINSFGYLLQRTKVDFVAIDGMHKKLLKHKHAHRIFQRSIRNLAIDWYFTDIMNGVLNTNIDLHDYFFHKQMEYLNCFCAQESAVMTFFNHFKTLLNHHTIPSTFFKLVKINFPDEGLKSCYAIFPADFFPFLRQHVPESNAYTPDTIRYEIKNSNSKYGLVNKNVSFNDNKCTKINRAIVIRREFLD